MKDAILVSILVVLFIMVGAFDGWAREELSKVDADIAEMQVRLEEMENPEPQVLMRRLEIAPAETEEPESELKSLGTFTVTAYCPCSACCGKWSNPDNPVTASGASAVEGVTVGADWVTIPEGTEIHIDGVGVRTVQDKPARWIVEKYEGKILDLYFEKHEDALAFRKQELEIWAHIPNAGKKQGKGGIYQDV